MTETPRDLKPGEVLVDEDDTYKPELVEVHHPGLGVTMTVHRDQLAQMDPRWEQIAAPEHDEPDGDPETPEPPTGVGAARARRAEHKAATPAAASEPDRDPAVTTENKE